MTRFAVTHTNKRLIDYRFLPQHKLYRVRVKLQGLVDARKTIRDNRISNTLLTVTTLSSGYCIGYVMWYFFNYLDGLSLSEIFKMGFDLFY